jgi:rod shape-determining protein MreD
VKGAGVLLAVVISVILQVTLARYTVGGRWVFDFVLVGVVFSALQWGPVSGLMAGTLGGLLQDVLAGQIVGVGGLAKSIVGFAAGIVGTQFVLTRPQARTIIVMGATLFHRFLMLGLQGLIDQHWPGVSWGAMLAETGINTLCAFIAFQTTSSLPGVVDRRRASRRSSLSKRQW